jgi:hypothetical protein
MKKSIILLIVLSSCSHKAQDVTGPRNFSDIQARRDDMLQTFQPSTITRCDYATFALLWNAVGGHASIAGLENPSGKWNRHFQPCYPVDSQSETSRDSYLSLLHLTQTTGDMTPIKRVLDYAKPLNWITGAGPIDVTSIAPLVPAMQAVAERLPVVIPGFSAHQMASYLWLMGRRQGALNEVEMQALKILVSNQPDAPIMLALLHRFTDGDQTETVAALDSMTDAAVFWGSAPNDVYYAVTVAIAEGR